MTEAGKRSSGTGADLIIENIDLLVLGDERGTVLRNAWVGIEAGMISDFGEGASPVGFDAATPRLNGAGQIALPGLINTHHHLYQNMARAYSPGNNLPLLPWLKEMNLLWREYREGDLALCTRVGLSELMLSGATTVVDHHYMFPTGATGMLDLQFEVASEMGVRFHGCRGSMDLASPLISEWAVEETDFILEDTLRLVETYHDKGKGSWRQVVVAPCAATSCSEELLRRSAELAKAHELGLHTHCGETVDENEFSISRFGCRPMAYLLDCGWDGAKVWLAHGIHFDDEELDQLKRLGFGVAHCPSANMRLGSGICRVPEMLKRGIAVGIGVDGSASSDSGHLLGELRQALYLARVRYGAEAMTVAEALSLGGRQAAAVIGRGDLGQIATGYCGDLALFPARDLYSSGAESVVEGLLFCQPRKVQNLVIGGCLKVRDGELLDVDLPSLIHQHDERASAVRKAAFDAVGR
ncbi:MAG: amidohydrolase family protein [Puniceicoccaceae bacterium]